MQAFETLIFLPFLKKMQNFERHGCKNLIKLLR